MYKATKRDTLHLHSWHIHSPFPTCKSISAFSVQKASTNVQAYKAFLLQFTPSSKSVKKQCDIKYVHIQNWRPPPVSHSISQFSFAVAIAVKSRFTLNKKPRQFSRPSF
jgi:hypothetical protein